MITATGLASATVALSITGRDHRRQRLESAAARPCIHGARHHARAAHQKEQVQNSPMIFPDSSRSMEDAAGSRGRPGIVITSPQMTTMNSAPAARRTSLTLTT